jgi:hypothetical protein
MSETAHHLLIPFASLSACVSSEAAAKYLQGLKLPHLRQVLDALTLVDSDIGVEESFSPPHERALARALGLPVVDGCIPWAAQEAVALGLEGAQTLPWGFVTLCHADVGTSSMVLQNPDDLQVTEAESRQLLQAMQPYFAEDGLALHYLEPTRWLCCGEALRGVRTASLDRVLSTGLDVDLAAWQPQGAQASKLRRLQNEMQMLLYTHTVNDIRSRTQVAAINSIFFHGTGDLLEASPQVSTNIKLSINMPRTLADAALKEDWPAWAQAWAQLDATFCAALLQRIQAGEVVVLTLCGERSALRYESRQKTVLQQIKSGFRGVLGMKPAYLLPKQL